MSLNLPFLSTSSRASLLSRSLALVALISAPVLGWSQAPAAAPAAPEASSAPAPAAPVAATPAPIKPTDPAVNNVKVKAMVVGILIGDKTKELKAAEGDEAKTAKIKAEIAALEKRQAAANAAVTAAEKKSSVKKG